LRVEELQSLAVDGDGGTPDYFSPVSLAIAAGECLVISGPSGAGKTLLLRAIADLDPNRGQVYLDDQPREGFVPPEWRRRVAYVPAESAWWDERIRAHFPGRRVKFLREFGFEMGILRRQVARLSTGERQRLALLRAINLKPQVLLLDEPTASLDADNTRRVEALIEEYRRENNAAVLWVSHDNRQIKRIADRHLRFRGGKLVKPRPARKRKAATGSKSKKKAAPRRKRTQAAD
jgi:ABC-type iron transport system FetAB ATPase subunit